MTEITVGGESRKAMASVLTLMLYEQEFGKGLIEDLFGKVENVAQDEDVVIDFTATNWTAMARVLWACLKTADDSLPGFAEWSRGADDLNMFEVAGKLNSLVNGAFFRTPDRTPEA